MIIGASLGSFKGLELKEAMELYLKLSNVFGLNAVEIRFEKEKGRPSLWSWEVDSDLINFLENFEVTGAHLPFIYLNPICPNPGIRTESINQLKNAITKASELGMNYVVMHARGCVYGLTYEQQMKEWEDVIRKLAEHAEDNSILLTLENADFLSNLKDLVSMVREINSKWLKVTLDVGHAHLRKVPPLTTYPIKGVLLKILDRTPLPFITKRYMPFEKYGSIKNFLESESDLIFNLHIHDYDGKRDHIAIGEGKIDFSFLAEIKNNFKGPYIFEVELENYYSNFEKNYRRFTELMKA